MKIALTLLIFFSVFTSALLADDLPPPIHKSSRTKQFDPAIEVLAYYSELLAHNSDVKHQFDSLAKKSVPHYGEVHSGTGDPQVVEWFPRQGTSFISENVNVDTRYLVIHPLQFVRTGHVDYQGTVVSEFRIRHIASINKPGEKSQKLASNEITITFLGFREFKLTPADTK